MKNRTNIAPEPFILFRGGVRDLFDGYAFSGSDLIIGESGLSDYILNGRKFSPDSDGCYVHLRREGGRYVLETDFHGYYPIFWYAADNEWAISSSLTKLARQVKARGWPLSLRTHQLEMWKSAGALMLQLASCRTVFNEIHALPYDSQIEISDGLKISQKYRHPVASSYEQAIDNMISEWSGRINSIMSSGMEIVVDLSGGVDSRTIFSLMVHTDSAFKNLGLLKSDRLRINSSKNLPDDYAVAALIAEKYGVTLNRKLKEKIPAIPPDESVRLWRQMNVGRYAPHILPGAQYHGRKIVLSGAGGEEHRPFYETKGRGRFDEYIERQKNIFSTSALFKAWRDDLMDDITGPQTIFDADLPLSVRHYRRHRGRHHASKQPLNEMVACIFGSKSFYECSYFAGEDRFKRNQILFDIMLNCSPDLATLPYDKPHKAPSAENISTRVLLSKKIAVSNGQVWGRNLVDVSGKPSANRNIALKKFMHNAMEAERVQNALAPDEIKKARDQASKLDKRNLHSRGATLHYVALLHLVAQVTPADLDNHVATHMHQNIRKERTITTRLAHYMRRVLIQLRRI